VNATASAPASQPQFSTVTEQPGQQASRLQLDMMAARYAWAHTYAAECDVLEVACGTGVGLAMLAESARTVHAGDLDEANLSAARRTHSEDRRIALRMLDAMQLPYPEQSFDLVLLFEAIYYLPSAPKFFEEARRVLRPGGHLLLATVNCEWSGFNPSPYHTHYLPASELSRSLLESGFAVALQAGFPEQPSVLASTIGAVRRAAVALDLIPHTMGGKALLKHVFYGRLRPVPTRLLPGQGSLETLVPLTILTDLTRYRVLYASARKNFS